MPFKTYDIGGRTFTQDALVWGQVRLLQAALDSVLIPDRLTPAAMVEALGPHLPHCLAAVLVEAGKLPGDADPEEMAGFFERHVTVDQALEAVEDFFTCNPIASVLNRFARLIGKAALALPKRSGTPSEAPSPSSPEGTSPSGTASCGDTPRPSPSPTSGTAGGKPCSGNA